MAGLYSLYKTFVDDETLTNEDLNASFQRILDNSTSDQLEGYSTLNNVPNNTRMDSTADPYPASVRSYATSIAGEIQRLRYMIKSITGNANWYQQPTSSLSNVISGINDAPTNDQIIFYSSLNDYIEANKSGVFGVASDSYPTGLSSSQIIRSGQKFGTGYLSVGSTGVAGVRCISLRNKVFTVHFWIKSPVVTKPVFVIPALRAMLYCQGDGSLYFEMGDFAAASSGQKSKVTITGTKVITDSNWHSVCVTVDGSQSSGSRVVRLIVDGAEQGTSVTTGTFVIPELPEAHIIFSGNYNGFTNGVYTSGGSGGNSAAFSSDTPTGYSKTGSVTVSSGVATMVSAASAVNYSASSPQVSIANASTRTFCRLIAKVDAGTMSSTATTAEETGFGIRIRDDAANKSCTFMITDKSVGIADYGDADYCSVPLNATDWHIYDFVILNSVAYAYVDGVLVATLAITASDVTAGDLVKFGFLNTSNSGSVQVALFENFNSNSQMIQENGVASSLDDIVVFEQAVTTSSVILSQLQLASAGAVLKATKRNFLPDKRPSCITAKTITVPSSSSLLLAKSYPSDGDSEYLINITGNVYNNRVGGSAFNMNMLIDTVQSSDVDVQNIFGMQSVNMTFVQNIYGEFSLCRKIRPPAGYFTVLLYGSSTAGSTEQLTSSSVRIEITPIRYGV